MNKLVVVIRIPEHFHAEDELSNLLNDDGMLGDLESEISGAVAEWLIGVVEGIRQCDVEVEVKRVFGTVMVE